MAKEKKIVKPIKSGTPVELSLETLDKVVGGVAEEAAPSERSVSEPEIRRIPCSGRAVSSLRGLRFGGGEEPHRAIEERRV